MRNISFALTTAQFLDGSKTVTRRLGWSNLKPGDRLMACARCMGLRKGEKPLRLGPIEVISKHREELRSITPADVIREGFPELTPEGFVAMFCQHMGCEPETLVNRIEYRRIAVEAE